MAIRDLMINLRARPDEKELIDAAAHAAGKSRTEFMLEAAKEKAQGVLLDRTFFPLANEQASGEFMATLSSGSNRNENARFRNLQFIPAPWES